MTRYEEFNDTALASTFAANMMPDQDVSARTEATRRIGGFEIIRHLIGGDWGKLSDEWDKPLIQEVLVRAIANAARNGIEPGPDSQSS